MNSDAQTVRGSSLVLRAGVASDVGRVRSHNEDNALADGTVFVVADGMGGHAAGEVASGIAVDAMRELVQRHPMRAEDIIGQLHVANQRILQSSARHPEHSGMGTTATGLAVVTSGGSEHWAVFNVGDSRTYRYLEGRLTQVTVDHTEVRELLDAGLITPEQASRHPLRNVITRYLGSDPAPTPDIWVFPPYPGERFVICSDGLCGELSDEQVAALLAEEPDPEAAARALVRAAVEAGGRDNVTAVVVALDIASDADGDNDADTVPMGVVPGEP